MVWVGSRFAEIRPFDSDLGFVELMFLAGLGSTNFLILALALAPIASV